MKACIGTISAPLQRHIVREYEVSTVASLESIYECHAIDLLDSAPR